MPLTQPLTGSFLALRVVPQHYISLLLHYNLYVSSLQTKTVPTHCPDFFCHSVLFSKLEICSSNPAVGYFFPINCIKEKVKMKKKRSGSAQLKKHFNNLVCLWQSEFFCNWKDVNEENRSDFWKLECEIAWSKFYLCSLNWRHQCSWTHIHANNILVIIFAIKIPGINVIIFTFLELCYAVVRIVWIVVQPR